MIVQPADFAKSRVLTEDFSALLAHLWRGGDYGYFWQSSLLRYKVTEVEQIAKKGVRKGQNKVIITTWVDLSQPLPSILPPQSFRAPFHNLSYRTIKSRLITPDDPSLLQLYFGVNPVCPKTSHLKKAKYGTRGQKSTMQAVNALIGDLDVKDFNGDWQALRDYVETGLLLPPSAIINTGGGLHLYFLMRQTFDISRDGKQVKGRFDKIDTLYKRWNDAHKFDNGAKDVSRVFRAPNSVNVKDKYAPDYPLVQFELLDLSRLYELADFERVLPTSVVPIKVSKRATKRTKSAKPTVSAISSSSYKPPDFLYLPYFTNERAKIYWYLQYFNHDDYHDWKLVGLALSGESEGFDIWTDWSCKSSKFDETIQQGEWERLQQERRERQKKNQTVAGIGSLIMWARKKGCPTMRDEGEYQPIVKATDRVKLCNLRASVGEALANLFVPDGQSWALLNPSGADSYLYMPRAKPLGAAILDHIGGGTRRALFDGKRRQTKCCVVVLPSEMTRVAAFAARDAAHALDVQNCLAKLGLTSFSYPLYARFHFSPDSDNGYAQKVAPNGQIDISYIYKTDALSTKEDLGKMSISSLGATFRNYLLDETELEHIVLVAFSNPIPQQLLHHHTPHQQLDPIACPYQLPSSYPPFCPSETLNISLVTGQVREVIQIGRADAGFKAWDELLKREILNEPMALAGFQAEDQEVHVIRTRTSEIAETVGSVTRWYNRRYVYLASQACGGCGDLLMTYDSGDGYQAGWCPSCGGEPVTNFIQTAHAQAKTLDELAVTITVDNQLGQAGDYVIEEQPQTAAVDMDTLIIKHEERVADMRRQIREDINRRVLIGTGKGRIAIIGATAGLGKSTITRELIPSWYQKLGYLTRVTTDTKKLSYEWHDGLGGGIVVKSFVFESMFDSCSCYSVEVKQEALAAGYKLKHNLGCAFIKQIEEMLRGEDRKQKKVAILRHEHLRLKINGKRLVAGADVYVSDEDLTKALIESDSVDLYTIVKATLTKMLDKGYNTAECGIVAALYEVCRQRRVGMYQHVNGSDIVKLMDEYLREQGLTLSFCLEAIKKTPFAQSPRLEPENVKEDLNLPKIWLPKFLEALSKTLKNPIHPSFFLVQTSKDKSYSRLEIESWIKHEYLPSYNHPLDDPQTTHIFLDATPNEQIYKALLHNWEGKIDFLTYTCPPSPQHKIIQIDGLNLTRKYLKDNLRVSVSKIATILNDFGLVLDGIITRKDIKEAIARHFGLDIDMVLNFRNQRGSNKFSNAETIMMFADGTMPTNAALRFAHALWSHSSEPFEVFSDGSYFAKSGARWVAFDTRLQAVLDRVKAEGNQSSQRIRLINVDGMKVLIIVSAYDATELIDGLRPFQVTRIDAGRLHGNNKQVRSAIDIYGDRAEPTREKQVNA